MQRGVQQQQAAALRRPAAAGARRRLQLSARAAAEQPSVATASTDEDRVPPGCSRYTVSLPKPLGLVLEEGKGGRGIYVVSWAGDGGWAAGQVHAAPVRPVPAAAQQPRCASTRRTDGVPGSRPSQAR